MGTWRKSSYSGSTGGQCVETASDHGVILVRDTTNRDGGTLTFGADAWSVFLGTLR
jgi:Domain of unknown function (DUF397)